MENREELRYLVKTYYEYQKMRIRISNRLEIKKNGERMKPNSKSNEKDVTEDRKLILEEILKNTEDMEDIVLKSIKGIVKETSLWKGFLKDVKGCGEVMAAVILSEIDINKATNASKIIAFAGLSPGMIKGRKWDKDKNKIIYTDTMIRQDRKTSPFLCPFNQFLRAKLIGVLGSSFLKKKNEYSKIYYDLHIPKKKRKDLGFGRLDLSEDKTFERKASGKKVEIMWKDTTEKHRHEAAIRKMVKIFLQDLYVAWRTIEGLSVRKSYAEEYLGRKHAS